MNTTANQQVTLNKSEDNTAAGFAKWAGVAGAVAGAGLALAGGKSPVSALIGGGVGAAGGYLVGSMFDVTKGLTDTATNVALSVLCAGVGFGLTTQVCTQAEVLMGNIEVVGTTAV